MTSYLPVYNIVTDFGAVSGSDCTTAIADALSAASSGQIIFVPDGEYYISSPVGSSSSGIKILGESWNAVFIRSTSFSGSAPMLQFTGEYSSIENITLDGNGSAVTNTMYAEVELAGEYCIASYIQVIHTIRIGIAIGAANCTVQNCTVTGLATPPPSGDQNGQGIWADSGAAGARILDCNITGTGIEGIAVGGVGFIVRGNNVSNCHSYAEEGGGQICVYANEVTVANGIIEGNYIGKGYAAQSSGIEYYPSDCLITGNVIVDQQWYGFIAGTGSGSFQFVGNTVKNCAQGDSSGTGVYVSASVSNFLITNNRLIDDQSTPTQAYGLWISSGSNYYVVSLNDFTGNVTGGFHNGSSGAANKVVINNLDS